MTENVETNGVAVRCIALVGCPFCGGQPEVIRHGSGRQSSVIECTECGCRLEANESGWNTGTAWNTRRHPTAKVADPKDSAH